MSGYVKKIAVIKQLKSGFSADGGAISGIVKAETYAGFLKVEASLINFAPLSEGRYVLGICDGLNTVTFEGLTFEGETDFNLASGFAFMVCFCHGSAAPVAAAACGQMACALPDLKEEMTRREVARPAKGGVAYDDEAITEVNYFERNEADESGKPVREDKAQEKVRRKGGKDEEADNPVRRREEANGERCAAEDRDVAGGLARGDFYSRMEGDIEKIFSSYPREEELEMAMENSRFVKIAYGGGKHYVFGVLSVEGKPRYICYGVPAKDRDNPPVSLKGSSYVPTESGGYWLIYQDAATGVSVMITSE